MLVADVHVGLHCPELLKNVGYFKEVTRLLIFMSLLYCIFVLLEENIADRTQQMEQVIYDYFDCKESTVQ